MATLCFTGHRNLSAFNLNWIREKLCEQILVAINTGYDSFISGGAIGIDQLAAKLVLQARETHKIKLIFARPFSRQDSIWPQHAVEAYRELLRQADYVYDVCPDPPDKLSAVRAMQIRNEWMVDNSSRLIAVWDGNYGGTANCFRYAKKQRKVDIIRLDPARKTLETFSCGDELDVFES